MTIQKTFLFLLTATTIGLLVGHLWNKHSESKLPRMAHVVIGDVEIIHVSDKRK